MARIRKSKDGTQSRTIQWLSAFYIRLSRDDGNEESYSVKNQRQLLTAWFEAHALEESIQLIETYVDDGYTGTDSNRDDFQRMLRDLDEGKINCIIVKDLSRLSRNDWECKRYLQHLFVVKDVRFISLELPRLDSFRRPDEIYDLGVTMQSAYNENHCRETSIKVRTTFNAKRKAGEFIGAFAPYGYMKDPADKHRFLVDQEAACVVRDIFHWFVREGMSKNGIVKKLVELGIPCPTAYKRQNGLQYSNPALVGEPLWSTRGVTTILTNQMYLGHMVQGKQKVKSYKVHSRVTISEDEWFIKKNTHEAIIDAETFASAQDLMTRDTRTPPKTGNLYPFSGYLRCADCSKAMGRRPSGDFVYYACKTYLTTHTCSRHSIRHDKLEGIVLAAIQRQIDLVDNLAQLIDGINEAPIVRTVSKRLENSLKLRKQELERTSAIRRGLYADMKTGLISQEDYMIMKQEYEDKEARLKQDIRNLEEESWDIAQGATSSNSYFDVFRKRRNITVLDRGIVSELIKCIYVHEGGNVDIEFNFSDQHRRMIEFVENNQRAELELLEKTG